MARRKQQRVSRLRQRKWKGKEWYSIYVPKWLGNMEIGETPAGDAESVIGRTVEVTLFELVNDPVRYYMTLIFKINSVNGKNAATVYHGHYCTRDFIARIVQKRTSRIDTNEVFAFKDGRMRIKTITITRGRACYNVQKSIRKFVNEFIKKHSENRKIEDFVKDMISGKIQEKISKSLKKIHPIKVFEIHKTHVLEYSEDRSAQEAQTRGEAQEGQV